jgi:hypothetical protein
MRVFRLGVVLGVAALVLIGGCDGDDESDGGELLAQGVKSLPAGTDTDCVIVEVTVPGTLRGTITWSGEPTELIGVFRHVATTDVRGVTQSPSPCVTTTHVTSSDIAAGAEWLFFSENGSATDVTVQYQVTFTPD